MPSSTTDFDLMAIGIMYMLTSMFASTVCEAAEADVLHRLGASALGAPQVSSKKLSPVLQQHHSR